MLSRLIPVLVLALCTTAGCSFAPQNIEASVDAPERAIVNQPFVIKAKIHNTGHEEQKLLTIDFPDNFVQGIMIERTEPPFLQSRHNPGINTVSYKFNMRLQDGDERVIIIHATPLREGDYSGQVSFVVNADWSALSFPIQTVVTAPPEAPAQNTPLDTR